MLLSIQNHVQTLLDGMNVPGGYQTLTAYVQPPVFEGLSGPRGYVWGGHLTETRQSAPRGRGFKRLDWLIDVWLIYESLAGDDADAQVFPLLVDATMQTLRSAPMPVTITDPITGTVTQLVEIGERITMDYPPVHTAASQRTLYFAGKLTVSAWEGVQA